MPGPEHFREPFTRTGPGLKVGDRVEMIGMSFDPDPIDPGTQGTVYWIGDEKISPRQIGVKWDNGRILFMLQGVDRFRRIE